MRCGLDHGAWFLQSRHPLSPGTVMIRCWLIARQILTASDHAIGEVVLARASGFSSGLAFGDLAVDVGLVLARSPTRR